MSTSAKVIASNVRHEWRSLLRSEWGLRLTSVTVMLIAWQVVADGMILVAAPTQFVGVLIDQLFFDKTLLWAIVDGLQHGTIGYVLAVIFGIPLGFLIGFFEPANDVLSPIVDALYVTPLVAFVPLFIIWFGLTVQAKIAFVFFISIFVIIINSEAGVTETPEELVNTARVFGASDWDIYREVHFKHALSFILAGLRLGAGRAVRGMVVAELFVAAGPLGLYLVESGAQFQIAELFAGITALSILGVIVLQSLQNLENRLLGYRHGRE